MENNEIILKKSEGIEYLQFKRLLQYEELEHAIVIKSGNMDARNNKEYTYSKTCDMLNLNKNNLVILNQKHTDVVQNVDKPYEILENCDGSITNKKELILTSICADCTPILMYDTKKHIIANIHSGWKGTVAKIGAKALEKMMSEYGTNAEDVICCFGPCIRQMSF